MTGVIDPAAATKPRRGRKKAPRNPGVKMPDERRSPDADLMRDLVLAQQSYNDLGNAERLIARHGRDMIWVEQIGWLVWDGCRWATEGGKAEAVKRAHLTARAILDEVEAVRVVGRESLDDRSGVLARIQDLHRQAETAATPAEAEEADELAGALSRVVARVLVPDDLTEWTDRLRKFASSSGNAGKISAMLEQAQPYLRRSARDLDAQPYLLTVRNGTIDLDPPEEEAYTEDGSFAGEVLRPHRREDLATRMVPVPHDRSAECPHFRAFLADILPDPDLRDFIQRWFGYCLTGDISEQSLAVFYGTGRNGKSTLLDTIKHVLGDYAATVPIETFLHDDRKRGGDATPDLARLPGVRLVLASEPEVGARFSESTIKTITGGEAITARHLFRDMFEYTPAFKLVISCNHRPTVRGQDKGIWRRILLVPFTVTIPDDKVVPLRVMSARLQAEAPGILNWMLDGYLMWREQGLNPPNAVREATEAYRLDSDPMGEFLRTCTREAKGATVQAMVMYRAYVHWAKANALDPVSMTRFGLRLKDRGFQQTQSGNRYWLDVELDLDAEALSGFSPDAAPAASGAGNADD